MNGQTRAILRAQIRSILNYWRKGGVGFSFTILISLAWYALFTFFAFLLSQLMQEPPAVIARYLPVILLGIFLYWQVIPVMMATTGFALDTRKLLVYPIPHSQLFGIDLLLRAVTSFENLILMGGLVAGALVNPRLAKSGLLAVVAYCAFNLFVASGVKELLSRLLARRRIRELVMFLFVLCAALPQLLVVTNSEDRLMSWARRVSQPVLPWSAAAAFIERPALLSGISVLAWTAAAWLFGRWQFERTLSFDAEAAASTSRATPSRLARLSARFFRWPSVVFRDPLAALVEKEVRFLARAPRFRLVFAMGFSFGLLIWVPMVLRGAPGGFMRQNYLVVVSAYALLLLGDVCFWNVFGFDRAAAQIYHAVPVRLATVLLAKNIAALFYIILEVGAIAAVCAVIRLPMNPLRVMEALSVIVVLSLYLMGVGNLTSTYNPRAVNPQKSTRSGAAAKSQFFLMFMFPLASIPVVLAYLARWAFQSEAAFFLALLVAAGIGACFYWVATDSSVRAAYTRREQFITALSQGEGPIS